MAKTEPRTNGDGTAARVAGEETASHQVDGGDVVSVEGVAEAERVGEGGGGHEGAMGVEDDAADGPDKAVDQGDEGNDQEGGQWYSANVCNTGVMRLQAEEGTGLCGLVAGYQSGDAGGCGGMDWRGETLFREGRLELHILLERQDRLSLKTTPLAKAEASSYVNGLVSTERASAKLCLWWCGVR